MKSKGFTLIELLAVIVVLGIILVIAIPNVIDIISKTRTDVYFKSNDMLVKAAKNYLISNSVLLPKNIGETIEVKYDDLKNNNLIDNIKNPISNNDCNGYVLVTKIGGDQYEYSPNLNCTNNIGSYINDGLIGYWKLDNGQLIDYSGNGNNGSIVGSPTLIDCKFDKCYKFNTNSDYITIPHNTLLSSQIFGTANVFTLATWVYPTLWEDWGSIVNKATAGSWSNVTVGIWTSAGSGFTAAIGSNVDNNPSGSYNYVSYKPTLNEWHYVVAVADGTKLYLYVDGILRGSAFFSALTYPRSENIQPITIGRRSVSSNPTFKGMIDEIKIYNRALTSGEIKFNYDIGRYK